jgi:hypothetical protein
MLLELADHPQEDVSALAVAGLLRDDDLAVTCGRFTRHEAGHSLALNLDA